MNSLYLFRSIIIPCPVMQSTLGRRGDDEASGLRKSRVDATPRRVTKKTHEIIPRYFRLSSSSSTCPPPPPCRVLSPPTPAAPRRHATPKPAVGTRRAHRHRLFFGRRIALQGFFLQSCCLQLSHLPSTHLIPSPTHTRIAEKKQKTNSHRIPPSSHLLLPPRRRRADPPSSSPPPPWPPPAPPGPTSPTPSPPHLLPPPPPLRPPTAPPAPPTSRPTSAIAPHPQRGGGGGGYGMRTVAPYGATTTPSPSAHEVPSFFLFTPSLAFYFIVRHSKAAVRW
jgi:hypothetical protein